MILPVFPLPIFLLPQGITRLRIFEQRYLKMVRLAAKNNGFVLLLDELIRNKQVLDDERVCNEPKMWASWVDIVNFDQDDDGVLVIDVKCKSLVNVAKIDIDEDRLHHADVSLISHWPSVNHDEVSSQLSDSLLRVFEQNDELNELYQSKFIDNANWVLARWLELLPVKLSDKQVFADSHSFHQAKTFVENVVIAKNNK